MRIPTYQQFETQSRMLTEKYQYLAKLQKQIDSGSKIEHPSDDPILGDRIRSIQDYIKKIKSYEINEKTAHNKLSLYQTSVASALGVVGKINELIQAASSDATSEADRKNIANELSGYLENLLNISNTRDSNGEYIYSGLSSNTTAFGIQNGSYKYFGSNETSKIDIGVNTTSIYNISGNDVFGKIRTGNGSFTVSVSDTNTGTVETSAGSISDFSQYTEDDYTIRFVTNSAGKTAIEVTGAASGQVIPPPPATSPDDAPEYISGSEITFNGMTIKISGTPVVGDEIFTKPSENRNIFESLKDLITTLKSSIYNNADKAKLHQKLTELSAGFIEVHKHLLQHQTDIGVALNNVEEQIAANKTIYDSQNLMLGKLAEVDRYQVITEMSAQELGLEIMQTSYKKIRDFMTALIQML